MRYLYVFAFLFCLSSCSTCSLRNARERMEMEMERQLDSLTATMEAEIKRDSMERAYMEELERKIDSITGTYLLNSSATNYNLLVHPAWNQSLDLNRNGLLAVVYESTGDIVLLSTLPGLHSTPHNRVVVEINGTTYTADSNYTYALTQPDGYGHVAVPNAKGEVLYVLEEQAYDLIEAIAKNPDAAIKVTAYCNGEVYASYTLSEKDKQAIAEVYRLCLMMRELNALKEKQSVEFDD